jgi:hypothetical protein
MACSLVLSLLTLPNGFLDVELNCTLSDSKLKRVKGGKLQTEVFESAGAAQRIC